MRSNLPTEKKLNTLVKKSVDLKPLQILGWKGIKSKNTAILTLKYPSWEQKVRRPRVKKSGDKKSGKTSNLQGKLVFVQKWGRRTFSMEIGWFWGEIRVLWWRQLINTAVGHYLWGIDTFRKSTIPLRILLMVGHYLWGIDTIYPMDISPHILRSDITYEELILSPSGVILIKLIVLSVGHYLWGIDTYIELRLLVVCCFIKFVGHYLWGIDTIIPFLLMHICTSINGSDITYEELILSFHFCQLHISSFFRRTLPMRNWYTQPCCHLWLLEQSDITYEELIHFIAVLVL